MKWSKFLLFIFFPICCFAQDSLRYNELSLGTNIASLLNASPELNAEYILNRKVSVHADVGYRPYLSTLNMTNQLQQRKTGGAYTRIGVRLYNKTHERKKCFYYGAGIIFATYKSSATIVIRDYYDRFYRPVSNKQNIFGLNVNLGFQRKIGTKFLLEMGGAYNLLFNRNDTILNEYARFSSAQAGMGNIGLAHFSRKTTNGLAFNVSIHYILFYRNDKLKNKAEDYAR